MNFHRKAIALVGMMAVCLTSYLFYSKNDNHKDTPSDQCSDSEMKYFCKNLQSVRMSVHEQNPEEAMSNERYPQKKKSEGNESSCEVIHVCFVCTGFGSTRALVTVVKSLIFHRKNRFHFHFLSDKIATRILQVLFETWMVPSVAVTFYDAEALKEKLKWIPNSHYSGVNGLLKIIVPDVLPNHVDKVIMLDTDLIFLDDIGELWKVFQKFEKGQAMGLIQEQGDWYLRNRSVFQIWPAEGSGYNSGVILLNLKVMRSLGWSLMWEEVTRKYLKKFHHVGLADQDVFNAVIYENSSLIHKIPCFWNVQISMNFYSEVCYNKSDPKIIHWNSQEKHNIRKKNAEHFRTLFLIFLEYNGNLLKQDVLVTCNDDVTQYPSKEADASDEGRDFYRERLIKRRIHLYYLDYSASLIIFPTPPSLSSSSSSLFHPSSSPPSPSSSPSSSSLPADVTLVAQLIIERIPLLDMVALAWQGPISLALYMSDTEVHQLMKFVQGSAVLGSRRNIGYHVVYKEGQYYPLNYLRNVALENVNTRFAFLSDIDFLPLNDLYDRLKQHIVKLNLTNMKRALVIPAFETERYKYKYPSSKTQVIQMLEARELFTFRYHEWPQGQMATNYTKWKEASQPYQVSWEPNYEPFIVIDRSAPRYDERFLGFGWSKVSHIIELDAMGYEFWVVPDSFILHLPLSPSFGITQYMSSESYRYCLRQLKGDFLEELSMKYGSKSLKYLQKK